MGFEKRGDRLRVDPCIPAAWPGFTLDYRYRTSSYHIEVRNPGGVARGLSSVLVDGVAAADGWIALIDDGSRHRVEVTLGPAKSTA
jgi:cyclic beta-1,2-glucan synthetase